MEAEYGIQDEAEDLITRTELEESMKRMKNDKSPGNDGIPIELIKNGSNMLKEIVLRVINEVWKKGKIPSDWGKTIIVPIYIRERGIQECATITEGYH